MVTANPSRTKIATCSDDRTVRIWSLASVLGDDAPGLSPPPTRLVGHSHAVVVHEWCPAGVQDGVELIATLAPTLYLECA
jgi:transducin (beta)-like 1